MQANMTHGRVISNTIGLYLDQGDQGTLAYVPGGLPIPIQGQSYALVFSDDFPGTSINPANWNQVGPWGIPVSSKWANFSYPSLSGNFSNISVSSSIATISAVNTSGGYSGNWTGGILCSGPTASSGGPNLTWQYGFFEALVKLPSGTGFWPAFWMYGSNASLWEIDIMEFLGSDVSHAYQTYIPSAGTSSQTQFNPTNANWTSGYHLFQMLWTSSSVTFYIDNNLVGTASSPPNEAMYMMLNFDVGGPSDWGGAPTSLTPSPAYYSIDYVKVYQHT